MKRFQYQIDDGEILQDFLREYEDLYGALEQSIFTLEQQPANSTVLHALFRSVHTIKGNCGLLGIAPPVTLLQELETVLDQIRNDILPFQASIGDLILLVMDRCTEFFDQLQDALFADYDDQIFAAIAHGIAVFCQATSSQRNARLADVLVLLDPNTELKATPSAPGQELLAKFNIAITDDLLYIYSVADYAQSRALFWQGRLVRVVNYLIALNDYCGQPVSSEQLFVAACMHDIAMSMLPTNILHKSDPLLESETLLIQQHVLVASRLISTFPQWQGAKQIIAQHQEHFDGQGYPLGLAGNDICVGAQFLAIVHAFETIAYGYTKTLSRRRPFMRALMELNRFSGSQFNSKWIDAFMEVTRAYERLE